LVHFYIIKTLPLFIFSFSLFINFGDAGLNDVVLRGKLATWPVFTAPTLALSAFGGPPTNFSENKK
jgi:hypothetical protein